MRGRVGGSAAPGSVRAPSRPRTFPVGEHRPHSLPLAPLRSARGGPLPQRPGAPPGQVRLDREGAGSRSRAQATSQGVPPRPQALHSAHTTSTCLGSDFPGARALRCAGLAARLSCSFRMCASTAGSCSTIKVAALLYLLNSIPLGPWSPQDCTLHFAEQDHDPILSWSLEGQAEMQAADFLFLARVPEHGPLLELCCPPCRPPGFRPSPRARPAARCDMQETSRGQGAGGL